MYDPARDAWRVIGTPEIAPRVGASAVWAGDEAIVWGGIDQPPPGCHDGALDWNPYAACDGVTFHPAWADQRGQWYEIPPGPLSIRSGHAAVWAGDVMVIWGGIDGSGRALADGAVFDPQIHWLSEPLAPTERAESNRFWEPLLPAECPGSPQWRSLRAMIAETDLIVRGRAISAENALDARYDLNRSVITFEISEVLKGEPRSRTAGTVDLISYDGGRDAWRLKSNLPDGEHLLFLMYLPNVESDPTEDDLYSYYLSSYRSVIRELDGRVSLLFGQSGTDYLAVLDDMPFDKAVDSVRDAISSAGAGAGGSTRADEQDVHQPLFAC
jgi:hypothetical protein